MARPIVKYLDPVSGEYEFATVLDIGDLNKLNTSVKTDIVSAINSILSGGVGGGSPIDDHRINQIEQVIKSLQDGTFDIVNFDSIDNYLRQEFLDGINNINEQNRIEMEAVLTQLDIHVNDVIQDYQERVAAQNVLLDNAQNTLVDAREALEDKAAELEMANIGFSELEYDFNELDKYITANVRTIDFDNFNAMTEDYESVVAQTSNEVGVDMRGSTLSYLTGRVTDAEASISAQADEITSKMSYDEFQYMPIPKYNYGENLLFNTFDFHDMWIARNGAQVTQDTFLFGKVVAFNSPTGAYDTISDDLIVGESYVFTAYVNIQPSSKKPTEGRFEPVSGSYDPEDFQLQIGTKVFNPKVYESLLGINGWVRIQQEFVADAVNPAISINPVGVDGRDELAYMSMPKLEQGLTVTPWQPHLSDEYATLSSTQSMIKQQANSIVAFVTEVQQLDDSYKQATSTFQMLADGFKANTEAIEAYEEAVARYGTEYSNINGKFEQRVWRDDFQAVIEDINIDNRNRVLNSDFIRNHLDPSNRRLIVEDWSINEDWYIESTENNEYLCRKRTGLTNALATTATSNYFPVRNGERVLFSFELIHSGLDDDKVFAIELFDITDRRLLKQEFSLESMTQVGNRYHGSFSLQSPGAEKGRVVLQLPKNGEVKFTRVSFQNADIGSVDWSPAPEDSWIIQSRLATYISQVEDEVTIGGVGRKLDTLTGLLSEDKGTFTLNPDKIATEVVNSKTYDDMGVVDKTNFEQTASGWMNEITSDGRLAGYVNATPDTYKISFDKIHLEGTTWADALGSSRITVTDRFALVGQNGRPVLNVKSDGSVAMNVSSLNIGDYSALTESDKGDIQDEVTQNVISTTQPYIHIAYADTIEGEGLSFIPSGKGFIGFAKSHLPTPSATASNYTWSKYVGKDGKDGSDGTDGVPGKDGKNGVTTYTWIRYADDINGNGINNSPVGKKFIGFAYNKNTSVESDTPTDYKWSKILGEDGKDGTDGVPGEHGKDGQTTYTWIKYSPNSDGSSMTNSPQSNTKYIGIAVNKITKTESNEKTDYTWSKFIGEDGRDGTDGVPGKNGKDGQTTYTWIRYADTEDGVGIDNSPVGKKYIGFAYNKITSTESNKPGDYTWSKILGEDGLDGKDGVRGPKGVDGETTYTWIKYSPDANGLDMTNSPQSNTKYIGIAVNKTTPTESTTLGDYVWSKFIGDDGTNGTDGVPGKDGKDGKDGQTTYTWIRYADDINGVGINNSPVGKKFIGFAYNKSTATESNVASEYKWSKILGEDGTDGTDGVPGKDGKDGQTTYTWVKYSPSSDGLNMTNAPQSNTKYIGIAVNKITKTESNEKTDYTWSKFIGEDGRDGTDGVPGKNGKDGQTTYTWVKYADTETGVGLHDKPAGKKYIGLAFNKTDPTESTTPSDYQWSLLPQNIQVGGRNLLKASNVPVTNTSYPTQMYVMTEMMEVGQTYTLRLKGSLGAGKTNFGAWIDGGSISLGSLKDDGNGFYSMTFTGKKGSRSDHNVINIYPVASSVTAESTIEWIKLEKGDVPTDWSPAPEEVQEGIDEAGSLATSARDIATLAEQIASENSRDLASLSATDFIIREGFYQDMLAKIQEDIEASNLKIGPISTTTENIEQNFVFGEAGMTIGRDNISSKLNLTNNRISFLNDDSEDSTYITGNTLFSHNIVVRDALTMINHTISNYEDKTVFRFVEKIEGE